jgi:CRISPR/Cas system CSM-associated protein Csm3 (group 7 of RAMP superfamily)
VERSERVMSQFVLPYDFIEPKEIQSSYSYQQKGNLTGVMHMTMTVKTPLFAVKAFAQDKPNPRIVPASSIKGMIRNAAEIIWNDHITVLNDQHQRNRKVPEEWKKNNITIYNHGLGSHLFGFTSENNSQEKDGEPLPNAMKSSLLFTDAEAVQNKNQSIQNFKRNNFALMKPEGLDCKYYLVDRKKKAAGRKIYLAGTTRDLLSKFHMPRVPNEFKGFIGDRELRGRPAAPEVLIAPKSVFTFKVYFNQITKQQLADVVRLFELKQNAYHALGKGKPLGFGRVELKVDKILTRNKSDFFDLSKTMFSTPINKADLTEFESKQHEELFNEFIELSIPYKFNRKKSYATKTIKAVRYRLNKQDFS